MTCARGVDVTSNPRCAALSFSLVRLSLPLGETMSAPIKVVGVVGRIPERASCEQQGQKKLDCIAPSRVSAK